MKRFMEGYACSWWRPSGVAVLMLGVCAAVMQLRGTVSRCVEDTFAGFLIVSLLGIPVAAVTSLLRRRWLPGIANLAAVPIMLAATLLVLMSASLLSPSEDGFADELTIPAGIEITEPKDVHSWPDALGSSSGLAQDGFQRGMLDALKGPGSTDTTVTANVPSLFRLQREHPDVLRRYLSCSPSWLVFEKGGTLYATRRWSIDKHWHSESYGHYSHFGEAPVFQTGLTLRLTGKAWARSGRERTRLRNGETRKLVVRMDQGRSESDCVVAGDGLEVSIYEESNAPERRLTKAALAHLESEFSPLAESPSMATVERLLPSSGVRYGKADIMLLKAFQGGIYESQIWANTGEPGKVYLKAFEVTHNTPLSASELRRRTGEYIGWSDDPRQLFLAGTEFTIYEGDWDKPYAARFEVWFAPDSGERERKLAEKVFKIEGWQH